MNKDQIDYLSEQIVKITNRIEKLLDDKKVLLSGYNTEIKDSRKRIKIYAKAVEQKSFDPLTEIMEQYELEQFNSMGNDDGSRHKDHR